MNIYIKIYITNAPTCLVKTKTCRSIGYIF